ncbi:MAG TPA: MMPL family transporter [Gammaproteobacteria bacterium]|nr:MMPL family transporter [Gammaproteobacteria bacterium]
MINRLKSYYRSALLQVVRLSVRHAVALVAFALLATAGLAWYTATHISLDTDTTKMLDPNLPFRKSGREFSAAFPQLGDQIVLVLEAEHAGEASDAADDLADALRQRPKQFQHVEEPGAGEYFAHYGLLYLSTDELWTLDEKLAAAAPFLGTLSRDPSLRGLCDVLGKAFSEYVSPEDRKTLTGMFDRLSGVIERRLAGRPQRMSWRDEMFKQDANKPGPRRAFVLTQARLDFTSLQPGEDALKAVHEIGRGIESSHPGVRVRVTGSVAMDTEELATVARDSKLTTALSFGLVCLLLALGLRSPGPVLAVLITLTCGLIWTAAFAAFTFGALNLISVSFAVLFIGMGVDFGIQYAMRFLEESDRGRDRTAALHGAARGVGGALTLAAVAAAISFFAFVPTSYRGLAELGVIAGFSMAVALTANLTMLPALLSLLRKPAAHPEHITVANTANNHSRLLRRHARAILIATALLVAGAAWLLPRATFDFNPINLKDGTTESVATFRDLLSDPDTTPYTIEILAANLDAARELSAKLDKLPVVDKTVNLASYVPDGQTEKLPIIDGIRTSLQGVLVTPPADVPVDAVTQAESLEKFRGQLLEAEAKEKDAGMAASMKRLSSAIQRLEALPGWPASVIPELQKDLIGDLPQLIVRLQKALQAGPVTLADLPAEIKERYVAADGRARIEVYPKEDMNNNDALRRFVRAVQAIAPTATDAPVELLEGGDTVIMACIQAAALALFCTVLLVLVVLHSLRATVLMMTPLLLAMLFTVAASVLLHIPFNFANIIALPLLIGLNNAYAAYLVLRHRTEGDVNDVLTSSTPRAVLFSGLTIISSFGTMAISTHPGLSGMGVLISLSLALALLCSLIVLPALLYVIDINKK